MAVFGNPLLSFCPHEHLTAKTAFGDQLVLEPVADEAFFDIRPVGNRCNLRGIVGSQRLVHVSNRRELILRYLRFFGGELLP